MKITIRLRPGRDDDIKSWYKALPRGDRSSIIRDAIKEFICKRERNRLDIQINSDISSTKLNQVKVNTNLDSTIEENIESKLDNLLDQI